jgi:hypothetical protein
MLAEVDGAPMVFSRTANDHPEIHHINKDLLEHITDHSTKTNSHYITFRVWDKVTCKDVDGNGVQDTNINVCIYICTPVSMYELCASFYRCIYAVNAHLSHFLTNTTVK